MKLLIFGIQQYINWLLISRSNLLASYRWGSSKANLSLNLERFDLKKKSTCLLLKKSTWSWKEIQFERFYPKNKFTLKDLILKRNPLWETWFWKEIHFERFDLEQKPTLRYLTLKRNPPDPKKKSTLKDLILRRNPPACFSRLTFSFSVSCGSLVSAICLGARWEIQMYSSRLSTSATVRVCATIQKFFVQKSFIAADADGKKFFAQENTLNCCLQNTFSEFFSGEIENVQNMRAADKSLTTNCPPCKNTQHTHTH